jgi:ArsR family transcriptional regulator
MIEDLSASFQALGNPHRLAIVQYLLKRSLACCEVERAEDCTLDPASCHTGNLADLVGISKSTVSHHLKELVSCGLIERARSGRYLHCRINEARIQQLRDFLGSGDGAAPSEQAEGNAVGNSTACDCPPALLRLG